jgi:hypothetical protein
MSRQVDDLFVNRPVLSKREREQNRSLHLCSRTGRTAQEQLEQVNGLPISTCSHGLEQDERKVPLQGGSEKSTCSKRLEQLKWHGKRHRILTPGGPQCSWRPRPEHLISNQMVGASHMGRIDVPAAICATPVPHARHYAYRKKRREVFFINNLRQGAADHA